MSDVYFKVAGLVGGSVQITGYTTATETWYLLITLKTGKHIISKEGKGSVSFYLQYAPRPELLPLSLLC